MSQISVNLCGFLFHPHTGNCNLVYEYSPHR
uniref:Uncharacterized protein n=1 Tax=Rhizophora mucronata TaxID=61149 RepID=A0A2P2NRW9_RHIMU